MFPTRTGYDTQHKGGRVDIKMKWFEALTSRNCVFVLRQRAHNEWTHLCASLGRIRCVLIHRNENNISGFRCPNQTEWQFMCWFSFLFFFFAFRFIARITHFSWKIPQHVSIESNGKWMRDSGASIFERCICVSSDSIEFACNLMRGIILVCIGINYCLHVIDDDGDLWAHSLPKYSFMLYPHPVNYPVAL